VIWPSGNVRVMVATRPVDFRKGAEGLAALVRETIRSDTFSGVVYVFRAKRGGPGQADLLGRQRCGACREAAGEWCVSLAASARWRDALERGAASGAARRPQLAACSRAAADHCTGDGKLSK
jgi:hypothetical protein